MADKKSGQASPKLHKLNITKGGAFLLKDIVPSLMWYEGLSLVKAFAAQAVVQNEMADLKEPNAPAEAQDEWAKESWSCELTEDEREGLKACVAFYLSKARLTLTYHSSTLAQQLGII